MPDEKAKGVVEIASEPAAGTEPAHVSVFIDGDRRFTVRTSDLENIGAQLRGKKQFSAFNSIGLPIIVSLLTVVGTTLVGQFFQYVSWRNSTALQVATLQAERARNAFQKASIAISKRYYATFVFLGAASDLANRKNDVDSKLYKLDTDLGQQRFNTFYAQLKSWNEDYDQTLTAIDYNLDGPVLHEHERVSLADFENRPDKKKNLDCSQMLLTELERLNLKFNSLKVQFATLNYCFAHSIKGFNDAKDKAVIDNSSTISRDVKDQASALNENVRQMSDEFRCYAENYMSFLEQRKQASIFKPTTWVYNQSVGAVMKLFVKLPDVTADYLRHTREACDPSMKSSQK